MVSTEHPLVIVPSAQGDTSVSHLKTRGPDFGGKKLVRNGLGQTGGDPGICSEGGSADSLQQRERLPLPPRTKFLQSLWYHQQEKEELALKRAARAVPRDKTVPGRSGPPRKLGSDGQQARVWGEDT